MAQNAQCDVAIVGGRVAGASLALLLARQGRRVIVVDRDAFPSDTMSTHFMSPLALAHLANLGLVQEMLDAGFRKITRHRVYLEDCLVEAPAGAGSAFSLAPRRTVLDSVLMDHAVRAGATFCARTRADGLIQHDGRVAGLAVTSADDGPREIRAHVVVGADGKQSKVAKWVGAASYRQLPPLRPVFYGYFNGVVPLPQDTLEVFFGGDQIGFVFPMRPDEDCLALELQPAEFDTFRTDPLPQFEARFRALPGMAARLANARIEGKLIGVKGIENYFRVPFGDGWALTGDAAYLKDPSTGLGIGDALAQAFLLADALGAYFDGAAWEPTLAKFQRKRDKIMVPLYEATVAFTQMRDPAPDDVDWLRAGFSVLTMARRILAAIPGVLPDILPPPALTRLGFFVDQHRAARANGSTLTEPAPVPSHGASAD